MSLLNSSLTEHHRRGGSRKRASPFHLPSHVLVNGYYQHDLCPATEEVVRF